MKIKNLLPILYFGYCIFAACCIQVTVIIELKKAIKNGEMFIGILPASRLVQDHV